MQKYNHKNCQSLFGYAANVHIRSKGQCQLCGCGGESLNFDLWRQMTVEHLIGKSQGGYLKQIQEVIEKRFPELSKVEHKEISEKIDILNTVSACSFCNSTTSRDINQKSMEQLLFEATGTPDEVINYMKPFLSSILERKRADVRWKLESVKNAFETDILAKISAGNS